jgi:hypothetical protein
LEAYTFADKTIRVASRVTLCSLTETNTRDIANLLFPGHEQDIADENVLVLYRLITYALLADL